MLVAPDKFKGTYSAAEVAAAIAEGLRAGGRNAEELPVADGGEGTADALLRALGGDWREADASDALGRPMRARFALLDGTGSRGSRPTAVVEAAEASGLARIRTEERDAYAASSRGTGELIAAASEAGGIPRPGRRRRYGHDRRRRRRTRSTRRSRRRPGAHGDLRRPYAVRARCTGLRAAEGGRPRDGEAAAAAAGRIRQEGQGATRAASP